MPTSSLPKRPLPKTYRIERELIAEHNQRMSEAYLMWHGRYPICPDCYRPPHLCAHMNLKLKP
jgi:hypothetical protein